MGNRCQLLTVVQGYRASSPPDKVSTVYGEQMPAAYCGAGLQGQLTTWQSEYSILGEQLPAAQAGAGPQGQLTTWQSEYSILGEQLPTADCGAGLQGQLTTW